MARCRGNGTTGGRYSAGRRPGNLKPRSVALSLARRLSKAMSASLISNRRRLIATGSAHKLAELRALRRGRLVVSGVSAQVA